MRRNITVEGAVDVHSHCGPSPFDRRVDAYEAAVEAAEAGMDAIVFKEHFLPTVYGVPFVDRLLDRDGLDIEVTGGPVLNYCNGGFNPFVVEAAVEYGAEALWAPTIDSRRQAERTGGPGVHTHHGDDEVAEEYRSVEGLSALSDDGHLDGDLRICLRKVVEHDLLFGVGHLSFEETESIVQFLVDRGHDRVVVDHPNYPVPDFDLDQQRELVDLGATINVPFVAISPAYAWTSAEVVAQNVRELGVDNCVISSGVGQIANPTAPEALRLFGESLVERGLSVAEVDALIEDNPRRLLGSD